MPPNNDHDKRPSYGDNVIFKETIPGAPKGTKAQFLKAISSRSALVKITKRIKPSPDRSGEPHYVNGAEVSTLFSKIALDDGQQDKAESAKDPAWKPAYEPK
jgi:hypothetical protein